MRRNILLGLIALCGYIGLSAQEYEYIPLVREGVEWGYHDEGPTSSHLFYHYKIKGDTLINGITYKKCFRYNTCKEEEPILKGWLREQERKVYLLANLKEWGKYPELFDNLQEEVVLYDFTPNKSGDIMQGFEYGGTVEKIDSVLINGKLRKRIHLDTDIIMIVEGLGILQYGNLLHPFMPLTSSITFITSTLQYVKIGENNYEYNPYGDSCIEDALEETSTSPLLITQHPGLWIVTLPSEGYRMVEVIDTTGKIAWCEYIDSNANSVTIPTENLARGIYIVALTSQSGVRTTRKITL